MSKGSFQIGNSNLIPIVLEFLQMKENRVSIYKSFSNHSIVISKTKFDWNKNISVYVFWCFSGPFPSRVFFLKKQNKFFMNLVIIL